jgi:hypothetical protein
MCFEGCLITVVECFVEFPGSAYTVMLSNEHMIPFWWTATEHVHRRMRNAWKVNGCPISYRNKSNMQREKGLILESGATFTHWYVMWVVSFFKFLYFVFLNLDYNHLWQINRLEGMFC